MSSRRRRPGRFRQLIPRPPDAAVVEPAAAFARMDATEARSIATSAVLEQAFSGWSPEATETAGATVGASRRVAAAVLLTLLGEDDLSLVLIRRATHLRANPGEIAFPGGRIEPGELPLDAALREAEEEVALPLKAVRVLGALPPVLRAARPEPIAAFVARVHDAAAVRWAPNPAEVADLLITPVSRLMDPAGYWEEAWTRPDGQVWRMSFFDLGEDVVWGASARILVSFFDRLVGAR